MGGLSRGTKPHNTRTSTAHMPPPSSPRLSPRRGNSAGPPIDHTRWMAVVIEIVAIAGAIALAYLHSAT
jgi:hypothetical protein